MKQRSYNQRRKRAEKAKMRQQTADPPKPEQPPTNFSYTFESKVGLFGLKWLHVSPSMLVNARFRWVIRLYKDAKQVCPEEFVRPERRPPWTITAYMESNDKLHVQNDGGSFEITFFRKDIEDFDEIWLGLYSPTVVAPATEPELLEEWELLNARRIPKLFTNHCEIAPYEEDREVVEIEYASMRNRNRFLNDGKWQNWSSLKT